MTPASGYNTICGSFLFWRLMMRKYIYISVGGALGAVLRLAIGNVHIWNYDGNIPIGTLGINIVGAFILALFLTVTYEQMEVVTDLRLGVSIGLLGSFTTFSTLSKETVTLMAGGEYFSAIAYMTASVTLGLGAAYLGVVIANKTMVKLMRETKKEDIQIFKRNEGEV
jgi:CrcB protein